jgi:hypothetical protein
MGIFKKDELILDFNGLRTENVSSTIPYLNKLNKDANILINRLNVPYQTKVLTKFNETDNYDLYKLFEKSQNTNNLDNNFSETSPFISSDIYNNLVMKGGAKNKDTTEKDNNTNDDEEDESTTTEDSSPVMKHKKDKSDFKKNVHFFLLIYPIKANFQSFYIKKVIFF